MTMRAAVIIPVYNHGPQIGEVIRKTLKLGLPVFVVDDGSTDSTANIIDTIRGIQRSPPFCQSGQGCGHPYRFCGCSRKTI